jgi:hypothetical protein
MCVHLITKGALFVGGYKGSSIYRKPWAWTKPLNYTFSVSDKQLFTLYGGITVTPRLAQAKRLYTQRLLSLLRTAPLYTSGTLTCPRAPSERASTTAHVAPSEPPRIRTVPAKQHSPWSSNISAVNKSSPHAWQKSHHIQRPKPASRAGRGIKLPKAVFPNIWLSQSSLCY